MAIVAIIVAGLFGWLSMGDRYAPGQRRFAMGVAVLAGVFALYLILFDPAAAWDLRWVGKLIGHMGGHAVREILR